MEQGNSNGNTDGGGELVDGVGTGGSPEPAPVPEPGPEPVPGIKEKVVSVGDLIRRCNDAAQRMSNGNPHKMLMLNCGYALHQLVGRVAKLEATLKGKGTLQ